MHHLAYQDPRFMVSGVFTNRYESLKNRITPEPEENACLSMGRAFFMTADPVSTAFLHVTPSYPDRMR